MLSTLRLLVFTALIGGISLLTACKEKKPAAAPSTVKQSAPSASPDAPTAEDLKVARDAMPLDEVVARLRAGVPPRKVLDEVRRRRIPAKIVEASELRLAANGAGRELIAAMKDPANVLTAAQEAAYMQLVTPKQKADTAKSKSGGRS